MSDFLVVGGGVMGMMLARELSDAGASVTLVDRQACGKEASWAGGGIVSPLYPWRYRPEVTRLASWSQSSYVHLAQALKEETGLDPELRQKGMLMLAVDDADKALAWANDFGRPLRQVEASFVHELEPNLAQKQTQALWMPEVASVRNPRLVACLRESLHRRANVTIKESQGMQGLLIDNGQVTGVQTAKGNIEAGHTVLCTGAWTGQLLEGLGLNLPVAPVRGQMMLFKAKPGVLNRVVLEGARYIIPRNDGRILIGSTLEHGSFDKQTTQAAYDTLYESALGIMPALADYEVEHHWCGLRPGSPTGVPYIGAVPGYDGLSVNAGQYRNGLVLAPASTRLMSDLLLGRAPIVNPSAYALTAERLGTASFDE